MSVFQQSDGCSRVLPPSVSDCLSRAISVILHGIIRFFYRVAHTIIYCMNHYLLGGGGALLRVVYDVELGDDFICEQ